MPPRRRHFGRGTGQVRVIDLAMLIGLGVYLWRVANAAERFGSICEQFEVSELARILARLREGGAEVIPTKERTRGFAC